MTYGDMVDQIAANIRASLNRQIAKEICDCDGETVVLDHSHATHKCRFSETFQSYVKVEKMNGDYIWRVDMEKAYEPQA